MRQLFIIVLVVACFLPSITIGQNKTPDKSKTESEQKENDLAKKQRSLIRKSFKSLTKQVKSGDYAAAARLMTEKGRDEFTINPILTALMFSNMPADFQMAEGGPAGDEHIDSFKAKMEEDMEKQKKLLEKYKFDELEIEFDPLSGPNDKVKEEIKKILKKTSKPFEVAKSFRETSSAMMPNLFESTVESIDLNIKNLQAFVELEIKPELPGEEAPGVMVEVISPPVIVQFKKEGDHWLFHGVDEKKTREAMEEFMEEMGGQFGELDSGFEFGGEANSKIDY